MPRGPSHRNCFCSDSELALLNGILIPHLELYIMQVLA